MQILNTGQTVNIQKDYYASDDVSLDAVQPTTPDTVMIQISRQSNSVVFGYHGHGYEDWATRHHTHPRSRK